MMDTVFDDVVALIAVGVATTPVFLVIRFALFGV